MANENETNELEMNDLLGHTEDVMSSVEKGAQHKEARRYTAISGGKPLTSPKKANGCQILAIFVLLLGTIFFAIDLLYMSREGTTNMFEQDKKQSPNAKDTEGHKHTTSQHVPKTSKRSKNKKVVHDEDKEEQKDLTSQQFKSKAPKIAEPENEIANAPAKKELDSVDDPSVINLDQDIQSEDINSDNQMTIVDGIDDKDVYCEDLSQYQEWHNTKITLNDGIMYEVVNQMDHDKNAFTQGLTYARGKLFESDGLYSQSTVRILDRNSAKVDKKVSMESKLFAEGITYYKDTLVQITWKAKQGFIYNVTSLEEIDRFNFKTTVNQGWGITWDRCNDELIVTDGSKNLHFWDPNTMTEKRRVSVKRMDGTDALEMNEIEFWRGRVLANVWFEDVILVINPETGVVEKEYDFSQLWPKKERSLKRADVLNGISISDDPNILYFTGKLWDRMFSIRLLPEL